MSVGETMPQTAETPEVLTSFSRAIQMDNLAQRTRTQAEELEAMAAALAPDRYHAPEGMIIEVTVSDPSSDPRQQIEHEEPIYQSSSWKPLWLEPNFTDFMNRAEDIIADPDALTMTFLASRIEHDPYTHQTFAYGHNAPYLRVKCDETTTFTEAPAPGQQALFSE